tara:strand:- start:626 stop:763 length:138 start_codon:yes stop_codon:yes gene_type:complete
MGIMLRLDKNMMYSSKRYCKPVSVSFSVEYYETYIEEMREAIDGS